MHHFLQTMVATLDLHYEAPKFLYRQQCESLSVEIIQMIKIIYYFLLNR